MSDRTETVNSTSVNIRSPYAPRASIFQMTAAKASRRSI